MGSAIARFLGLVDPATIAPETCWLWVGASKGNGYGHATYQMKSWPAHRLSYQLFKGDAPRGLDVCHSCDNRQCVNPRHLFLGTRLDNMRDCVRKGRIARADRLPDRRGERSSSAKLTWPQVLEIRRSTLPATKLAPAYSISPDTIRRIRRNEIWKDAA